MTELSFAHRRYFVYDEYPPYASNSEDLLKVKAERLKEFKVFSEIFPSSPRFFYRKILIAIASVETEILD